MIDRGLRTERIKDRMAKIADQDTRIIVEINDAIRRMWELGYTAEQVAAWLIAEPPTTAVEVIYGDPEPWHGFESRAQAGLAALSVKPKKEWPASLQAVHERVTAYIRNQEPEREGGEIGLAVISIPAVLVESQAAENVRRFKRMKDGRLKEIEAARDAIDVEADEPAKAEVG